MSSFAQKQMELRVTLHADSFGGKGTEKIIKGLPMEARISKITGAQAGTANVTIWGLSRDDMSALTVLAYRNLNNRHNKFALLAGEEDMLSLVFSGEIWIAYADYNSAPEPVFRIEALPAYYGNLLAQGTMSISGDVPIADLMSKCAKDIGYNFRNEGVETRVVNAIYSGSPVEKMRTIARSVGATLIIENNEVVLLPAGTSRNMPPIHISSESGLIGYPSFSNYFCYFKTLYNPAYALNADIIVDSIVPHASGRWRIEKVEHNLTANMTNAGPWESVLTCLPSNYGGSNEQ